MFRASRKVIASVSFVITIVSMPSFAQTFLGGGAYKKNQDKESVRWTLADWMTQTQNFKIMDNWLAVNRALDFFEINLSGGRRTYDLTVGGSANEKEIEHYGLSVYWSIFGLEYEFEDSNENFKRESAQFNLRVFGTNSQTTNLVGFYGVRKWSEESPTNEWQNEYAGGKLTLYIFSFLGVEGKYTGYMRAKDKNKNEIWGSREEYGVFIDIVYVRLYGQAFKEATNKSLADGSSENEERDGTEAGVKFYF